MTGVYVVGARSRNSRCRRRRPCIASCANALRRARSISRFRALPAASRRAERRRGDRHHGVLRSGGLSAQRRRASSRRARLGREAGAAGWPLTLAGVFYILECMPQFGTRAIMSPFSHFPPRRLHRRDRRHGPAQLLLRARGSGSSPSRRDGRRGNRHVRRSGPAPAAPRPHRFHPDRRGDASCRPCGPHRHHHRLSRISRLHVGPHPERPQT